jgi:hypothetical protein
LDGLDPLRRIRLTGSARTAVIFVVYIPAYVGNNLHAIVVGTCQLGTSHCFGRIHVRILQHNYGIQTTQGGGKKTGHDDTGRGVIVRPVLSAHPKSKSTAEVCLLPTVLNNAGAAKAASAVIAARAAAWSSL